MTLLQSVNRPLRKAVPQIWAHRGARSLAPENTLAAGRKAFDFGADGWEVDVRMTADGCCVLLHDLGLLRTTDAARRHHRGLGPPLVTHANYETVRGLSAGAWYARRDPFGTVRAKLVSSRELTAYASEPVPSLAEALAFTRRNGWRINVEIKDMKGLCPGDIVAAVGREIRQHAMPDAVIVSSFRRDYLERMRILFPELSTAWLVRRVPGDILSILADLGAGGLHVHYEHADAATIAMLREAGLAVRVYTVNRQTDMERFIRMGVDGIITDWPHVLKSVLWEITDKMQQP